MVSQYWSADNCFWTQVHLGDETFPLSECWIIAMRLVTQHAAKISSPGSIRVHTKIKTLWKQFSSSVSCLIIGELHASEVPWASYLALGLDHHCSPESAGLKKIGIRVDTHYTNPTGNAMRRGGRREGKGKVRTSWWIQRSDHFVAKCGTKISNFFLLSLYFMLPSLLREDKELSYSLVF